MNLSNLPLICLTNISNFLPDRDKVTLTSLNKNLRNLTEYIYIDAPKHEDRIAPFKSRYPIWRSYLPMPDSESIAIQEDYVLISETYPHILDLRYECPRGSDFSIFPNLQRLTTTIINKPITLPTSLTHLNIGHLYDNVISNLDQLVNLEYLKFDFVGKNLDINLDNYPKLQTYISRGSVTLFHDGNYPNLRIIEYQDSHKNLIVNKYKFPNLEELSCNDISKKSKMYEMRKLTRIHTFSPHLTLNLSWFPKLKYFTGNDYVMPKCGLPHIVDMAFSRYQGSITDKLFPKLEVCDMQSHDGNEIIIDHSKLKTLNIWYAKNLSIKAPKLESLRITPLYPENVEFVGKFEELKHLEIRGGYPGDLNIDFSKFPKLETLYALDNSLKFEGVCYSLKGLTFNENANEFDLRKFSKLGWIQVGECLRNKMILGSSVRNVRFSNNRCDTRMGFDFTKNREQSMKYLDLRMCWNCCVCDGGRYVV